MARAGTLAVAALCACGYFSQWVTELQSPTITGDRFKTLTLLLGTSDQPSAVLAEQVEQRLNEVGLTVLPRPGRWRHEVEALGEICPAGQPATVDGVLFVWPDRLKIWECATQVPAYEVTSERAGADELVKRLVRYLRGSTP